MPTKDSLLSAQPAASPSAAHLLLHPAHPLCSCLPIQRFMPTVGVCLCLLYARSDLQKWQTLLFWLLAWPPVLPSACSPGRLVAAPGPPFARPRLLFGPSWTRAVARSWLRSVHVAYNFIHHTKTQKNEFFCESFRLRDTLCVADNAAIECFKIIRFIIEQKL